MNWDRPERSAVSPVEFGPRLCEPQQDSTAIGVLRHASAPSLAHVAAGCRPALLRFRRRPRAAFSLVELMIVMVLLSVIILGLLAVFNQTQRAFKAGISQVDVMEGGRATMDLIVRDVEQMTPVGQALGTGLVFGPDLVYFISFSSGPEVVGQTVYPPLPQALPGSTEGRTNILQQFFFIRRINQDYYATAYYVLDHDPTRRNTSGDFDGVGTLYRWTLRVPARELTYLPSLFDRYFNRTAYEWTDPRLRVLEGVVHFKITPFGLEGWALEPGFELGYYTNSTKVQIAWQNPLNDPPNGMRTEFYHGAIPTGLEIELAVVEEEVLKRVEGLPTVPQQTIRRDHLYEQAGKTHVFKQQVAIRNADERWYRP